MKPFLTFLLLVTTIIAHAADVTVNVVNFDFVDNSNNHYDPVIHVGDSIIWSGDLTAHPLKSADGQAESWDSTGAPNNYSHTFTQAGTFNYYCQFHGFDLGGGQVGGMSGSIIVQPAEVALVSVSTPAAVTGGFTALATVTLDSGASSGGIDVTLADNSPALQTPASAHVDQGASTGQATLTANPVATPTNVTITASFSGVDKTTHIIIRAPILTSLVLAPNIVAGSQTSTATIRLSGPAPLGGVTINLSDNSDLVTTPSSVQIGQGASAVSFTVNTVQTSTNQNARITATKGTVSVAGILTVLPTVLSSLSLSPTSGHGGMVVTGTVTLALPAPAGGATVLLSSANQTLAPVPASVLVPAGQTQKTFTIATAHVTSATNIQIVASRAGIVKPRVLTLVP